ncbi:MAG: methyltransferase [Acidimicrobiia bacterium]|nr:methyltransferase [Acidimicrobiia bacterium]
MELPADAYRTSVRLLSESGTPAYRRSGSHDPVTVDSCLVLHPLLAEMLSNARFEGAKEVEMRAGARTGERMVVAHPRASRLRLPEGVLSVSTAEVRRGKRVCYHEEAAGRRWQISAGSFFQVRPDGADALVALVLRAASEARVVTDLYAGVGLFAGALASEDRRVVAVEANRIAAADARKNLAGLDARIVVSDVARYKAVPADLVVADPSRAGLRADGVAAALSAGPARLVVVSCDAAALARDTVLLAAEGYDLTTVTPVDLFPHTAHVECVSIFDRSTD